MKKYFSLLMLCLFSLCAWAQSETENEPNPNRLIVVEKSGDYQGFLVERIDNIIFRQVEGVVAAYMDFKEFVSNEDGQFIYLSITRTPQCQSFQICVIPSNRMSYLSDEAVLASYVKSYGGTRYYQDFSEAQMSGFDFKFEPNADYTIVTLGYDEYGIACQTDQVTFHTPAPSIIGNPYVEATVDDVTSTTFTITFVPNDDVTTYSVCSFNLGDAEAQFNMWGPFMGFATIEQMVYSFGIPTDTEMTHTWTAMSPGTDYEVLIAALDAAGNYAPLISVPVSTTKLGGEGVAEVTITIGEMGGDAETGYYQNVVFTSNSDCSVFHAMLIEKAVYEEDWGEERVTEYLTSPTNPYNPWDSYWDLFGVDNGYWNVTPGTTYYAIAIGKNINDEWGPMSMVEFTTPDVEEPTEAPARVKPSRIIKSTSAGVTMPKFQITKTEPAKGIILK